MRIEDLDEQRSRREYADKILRDFDSLGLTWDEGPFYQHDREEAYRTAFDVLADVGVVYPCFCTRADLAAQSAPHVMGEKQVYDRRCLSLGAAEIASKTEQRRKEGRGPSFRLKVPEREVTFCDLYQGCYSQKLDRDCGDFIVRRADGGFAYQLAVVVDDAEQGVNMVARGYDLLVSTPQQIHLQEMLGLATPRYAHFPLFCAPDGRRLAKRNKAASYDELRSALGSPEAVVGHVAYIGRLQDEDVPITPEGLLETFDFEKVADGYKGTVSYEFDIC